MSKVIKKVPMEIIETPERMAYCEQCGSGWGIEAGHCNEQAHKDLIGTVHSCGNVIEDVTVTYVNKIPGYVLVKCDCGQEVQCSGFTSTCTCGADYNWNGTQLAPREQWGEDTDEDWWDCY